MLQFFYRLWLFLQTKQSFLMEGLMARGTIPLHIVTNSILEAISNNNIF
jgi:hypothetical protein